MRGLDQTGLSQKAGPVTSDVRITRGTPNESNHANAAGVDCLLAFDLLAAASDSHREGAAPGRTVVVGSVEMVPTGSMVVHPGTNRHPGLAALRQRLDAVSRPDANRYIDAASIAKGLFGSTTTANIMTLGVAVQLGALPVSPEHVERAIELNGVSVPANVAAFRFGRQWAVDPAAVEDLADLQVPSIETLDQLIDRLTADLADYQDAKYAERFRRKVAAVRDAERSTSAESTALTEAAARHLHKLMAYKDEYEVARLALLDESRKRYEVVGGQKTKVTYHLHPPMLRSMGMDRKIKFRRTGEPSFVVLRSMKKVRGTKLDPFGYAEVRRVERAMVPEFEQALDTLVSTLSAENLAEAVAIATLPDQVRGYEHIKMARVAPYRAELATRLADFS